VAFVAGEADSGSKVGPVDRHARLCPGRHQPQTSYGNELAATIIMLLSDELLAVIELRRMGSDGFGNLVAVRGLARPNRACRLARYPALMANSCSPRPCTPSGLPGG
jgi:hypothetical protein